LVTPGPLLQSAPIFLRSAGWASLALGNSYSVLKARPAESDIETDGAARATRLFDAVRQKLYLLETSIA
jgi:hypothetical protein